MGVESVHATGKRVPHWRIRDGAQSSTQMCSYTVNGEVKFRPQHRPKCYCQMRDKWCKSTGGTLRPHGSGESAEQRCENHAAGTAAHESSGSVSASCHPTTKVARDTVMEPRRCDNVSGNSSEALTEPRLAYEQFRNSVLGPKPMVCQRRARESVSTTASNSSSSLRRRSVDLSEIREYRAANPDNCCSSSGSAGSVSSSASLPSAIGHHCQVRCCLDRLQNVVPCDVDAHGRPLCSICGRVFSSEAIALQQYSGSSHQISLVNNRGATDNNRRDYSAVLDRPSLILEIHEYGQSRGMSLYSQNGRVADIRIANKMRPPNSLALRHQPTT